VTLFTSELLLPNRHDLPSEIAFLRARYPSDAWRQHHNYGELAAFWLQVHASLRAHGNALQQATTAFREQAWDAARFQRFLAPRLEHYLQHLEGHHHIEDVHYFPRFRQLDTRMVFGFDLLENDHDIIHDSVLATASTGRDLVQSLARNEDAAQRAAVAYADRADRLLLLLERHLSDEEDLVIPAMLEYGERPLR